MVRRVIRIESYLGYKPLKGNNIYIIFYTLNKYASNYIEWLVVTRLCTALLLDHLCANVRRPNTSHPLPYPPYLSTSLF